MHGCWLGQGRGREGAGWPVKSNSRGSSVAQWVRLWQGAGIVVQMVKPSECWSQSQVLCI